MDFVSHVLVGKLFQTASKLRSLKERLIVVSFAFMPDIPVFFVYLLLGKANNRPFWIAYNSDWIGVRAAHPWWAATWEIPHSIFFLLLIIVPLVIYFKLPKVAIYSYFSHIFLDAFTHTGEWRLKPFYPFSFMIEGFTDAWAWPLQYMAVSWIFLSIVIFALHRIVSKKRSSTLEI